MTSEEIRELVAETRDDRFQTAELESLATVIDDSRRENELTVLSIPRVMTMKKNRIAQSVDQFINAMVCG